MIDLDFILSGSAMFSIDTPGRQRFTFHVQHVEGGCWPESWFVRLWTGKGWQYVGKLDEFTGQVRLTARSKCTGNCFTVRLLNFRCFSRTYLDKYTNVDITQS